MRIIFAGGGTAGHVNPAIAAANYIKSREDAQIYLAGGKGNIEERLAAKAGYEIFTFPLTGLSRSLSPKAIAKNITALKNTAAAISGCKKIIGNIKPDIVVGTGGYASYPMVSAAVSCGVRTAIIEVNATPGVATKRLAQKVDCVMISFSETELLVPGAKKVVLTGSPIREEIVRCRNKIYEPLFKNGLPTLLSFWGSVGALYMNKKMVEFIRIAAARREFNLLHAAGESNFKWMPNEIASLGVDLAACDNIDLREYIFDMDRAMAMCDLAMCRAGGTLAELCAAGKPALIVPSPFVADNHQEKNARIMERAGAAVVLPEKDLTPQQMYDTAFSLLRSPEKLAKMSDAALKKAQPDALKTIYNTIKDLTAGPSR